MTSPTEYSSLVPIQPIGRARPSIARPAWVATRSTCARSRLRWASINRSTACSRKGWTACPAAPNDPRDGHALHCGNQAQAAERSVLSRRILGRRRRRVRDGQAARRNGERIGSLVFLDSVAPGVEAAIHRDRLDRHIDGLRHEGVPYLLASSKGPRIDASKVAAIVRKPLRRVSLSLSN